MGKGACWYYSTPQVSVLEETFLTKEVRELSLSEEPFATWTRALFLGKVAFNRNVSPKKFSDDDENCQND